MPAAAPSHPVTRSRAEANASPDLISKQNHKRFADVNELGKFQNRFWNEDKYKDCTSTPCISSIGPSEDFSNSRDRVIYFFIHVNYRINIPHVSHDRVEYLSNAILKTSFLRSTKKVILAKVAIL